MRQAEPRVNVCRQRGPPDALLLDDFLPAKLVCLPHVSVKNSLSQILYTATLHLKCIGSDCFRFKVKSSDATSPKTTANLRELSRCILSGFN